MPSNMFITAAAAVLSISGMANALVGTAPYQVTNATAITATSFAGAAGTGAYNTPKGPVVTANATSSALGSAKPTGIFTPDLLFCPRLNNQVFTDIRGRSYVIECGRTRKGVQIDITVIAKRQTATTLNTCILTCSESAACVGTAFNRQTQQCSYFSSIGEPVNDGVSEFAYVTNIQPVTVAPAGSTAGAGAGAGANGLVPSVVYTVSPVTIYSCAPTVTNCPLRAGVASAVVTSTIPLYTTLCPYSGTATTTIPASAVACTSCPVSAGTATVYSQTVQQGTTTVVPVGTAPINFVNPSGSASSTGASATVTNPAGATKSVQAFTGAAGHVEAGMGMAAVMAMAVLAL